jgi:hypothetical protein
VLQVIFLLRSLLLLGLLLLFALFVDRLVIDLSTLLGLHNCKSFLLGPSLILKELGLDISLGNLRLGRFLLFLWVLLSWDKPQTVINEELTVLNFSIKRPGLELIPGVFLLLPLFSFFFPLLIVFLPHNAVLLALLPLNPSDPILLLVELVHLVVVLIPEGVLGLAELRNFGFSSLLPFSFLVIESCAFLIDIISELLLLLLSGQALLLEFVNKLVLLIQLLLEWIELLVENFLLSVEFLNFLVFLLSAFLETGQLDFEVLGGLSRTDHTLQGLDFDVQISLLFRGKGVSS